MAAKDNSVKQLTGGIKMLFKNNKVTHLEGNWTWQLEYSWDLESDHSKSRNIQNLDFLKVGFQIVRTI